MRTLEHNENGAVVAVSAQDVANFNSSWPCSNVPEIGIKFEFDRRGNLVDIICADGRDSTDFDGEALLALSHDAQNHLSEAR
jgi:hypothetical protein